MSTRRVAAALVTAAALLAGCAGRPPPPAWQANAHGALASFSTAYLSGRTRLADIEFARARSEIAATGRPDLLARAELVRCAARVASLEFDDCPGFQALAADAGAPEHAYAKYLGGDWPGVDPALLPVQHRAVLTGGDAAAVLAGIEEPMARLVAAGILFRLGRLPPAGIATASETASANGWHRPLLAWLGIQASRAEAAGDGDAAARFRRRIDVIVAPE